MAGLLAVLREELRGQHRDVGVDVAALREAGQQLADVIGQPGVGKRRFQYAPDDGPVLRGACVVASRSFPAAMSASVKSRGSAWYSGLTSVHSALDARVTMSSVTRDALCSATPSSLPLAGLPLQLGEPALRAPV